MDLEAKLCIGAVVRSLSEDINYDNKSYPDDDIEEFLEDDLPPGLGIIYAGYSEGMETIVAIRSSIQVAEWCATLVDASKYDEDSVTAGTEKLTKYLDSVNIDYAPIGLLLLPLYW